MCYNSKTEIEDNVNWFHIEKKFAWLDKWGKSRSKCRNESVVYFDQLSSAVTNRKLVEKPFLGALFRHFFLSTVFHIFCLKRRKNMTKMRDSKMLVDSLRGCPIFRLKKCSGQLSGARSFRKLIKIHNRVQTWKISFLHNFAQFSSFLCFCVKNMEKAYFDQQHLNLNAGRNIQQPWILILSGF